MEGKGIRGADCIQVVRNNIGQNGKDHLYESISVPKIFLPTGSKNWKRRYAQSWCRYSSDRYTQAMPKYGSLWWKMVYGSAFAEVKALAHVLRRWRWKFLASNRRKTRATKCTCWRITWPAMNLRRTMESHREGFLSWNYPYKGNAMPWRNSGKHAKTTGKSIAECGTYPRFHCEGISSTDSINLNLLDVEKNID